jgi:hypothetical protein
VDLRPPLYDICPCRYFLSISIHVYSWAIAAHLMVPYLYKIGTNTPYNSTPTIALTPIFVLIYF